MVYSVSILFVLMSSMSFKSCLSAFVYNKLVMSVGSPIGKYVSPAADGSTDLLRARKTLLARAPMGTASYCVVASERSLGDYLPPVLASAILSRGLAAASIVEHSRETRPEPE